MSHSQFHCTGRAYLDLHGLIFETSICYWQDQPGSPRAAGRRGDARPACALGRVGAERNPLTAFHLPGCREARQRLWRGDLGSEPRISGGFRPAVERPGGVSGVGFEKHCASGRHRRIEGSPGGDIDACDGLRCRTARADGAARSRYQSGGPGGTRRGGGPPGSTHGPPGQ